MLPGCVPDGCVVVPGCNVDPGCVEPGKVEGCTLLPGTVVGCVEVDGVVVEGEDEEGVVVCAKAIVDPNKVNPRMFNLMAFIMV